MKIEIAEPGRMTQSGSSLLRLIQNNNMPILDLLVRESIQNSLDAQNDVDKYVTVEYKTGKFKTKCLNNELEGITEALNNKFSDNEYEYISIRDTNTIGLTGKLHYDEVTNNNYGNLLKLIYEISKPQETEGAGGSWGLGKTVYFRVGIGLVIYYSRIKNEYDEYESRLAATFVENEMSKNSIIPAYKGKSKRGIAWWGEKLGENKTQPITDEQYINQILDIFSICPYNGNATGTTIIIPYINSSKLLNDNHIEYYNGEKNTIKPFWRNSIEEYLKIAVERWYAPRLNNNNYPYGKFLRVKINNKGITRESMEPPFQIIQALYNRAVMKKNDLKDILDNKSVIANYKEILLKKVLKNTEAGVLSYAKVNKNLLKMNYPDNELSPYIFFNCQINENEKNKPIILFTRKPGMIVSYESMGAWADGIGETDKDEFIIAIFVLNSENKLTAMIENNSLEEYIRKSEMADHTSWNDFTIGSNNPRIISKIQYHVKNKIYREFSAQEYDDRKKLNSGFGKMFGDLLLPPENFGNKPSPGNTIKKDSKLHIEKHRNVIFILKKDSIKYFGQTMEMSMQIKSRYKIRKAGIFMAIDSEGGTISVNEWENGMGLNMPFYIENINISFTSYDNLNNIDFQKNIILDGSNIRNKFKEVECELLKSYKGIIYAVELKSKNKHSYVVNLKMKLHLIKRDVKPVFLIEKDEGDK